MANFYNPFDLFSHPVADIHLDEAVEQILGIEFDASQQKYFYGLYEDNEDLENTLHTSKKIKLEQDESISEISATDQSSTDFSSSDFEKNDFLSDFESKPQITLAGVEKTMSALLDYKEDQQQQLQTKEPMKGFDLSELNDFKHVIYNMLVENYNNPSKQTFVLPVRFTEKGVLRTGFKFNSAENPDRKIPELYAMHIRKSALEKEDSNSVFIQDLYKFYYRASMELLSKYFEKRDKYTFLDEEVPLFVPNGSLQEAEVRLKQIKTRARKKRSRAAAAAKEKST